MFRDDLTMAIPISSLQEALPLLLACLGTLLCVLLTYIFYPALSLAASDAIVVQEELLSAMHSTATSEPSHRQYEEDSSSVLLSIVIPAYNEETRLPIMLDAAVRYIQTHETELRRSCQDSVRLPNEQQNNNDNSKAFIVEWIVVNDGSTDSTTQVTRNYAARHSSTSHHQHDIISIWRLVTLTHNGGKGAAVKAGMLRANGHLCLMVDADGATDFGVGLERLCKALASENNNNDNNDENTSSQSSVVAFGSRAHLEQSSSVAQRSWIRTCLMKAFHFFVTLLCSSRVRDTQCGFKLFPRTAAHALFRNLHLQRWAFDIELVLLAERLSLGIVEVPVPWQEVDGSKLDTGKLALAWVSIGMLRDMLCVRACFMLGIWRVKR